MVGTIIIALISSGVLSTFITAVFQYLQTKKSQKTGLESKVDKIAEEQEKIMAAQKRHEMDILRVELKLMISDFPTQESDILRIAQHYFTDGGNWVMSSVFQSWLDDRELKCPSWFNNDKGD